MVPANVWGRKWGQSAHEKEDLGGRAQHWERNLEAEGKSVGSEDARLMKNHIKVIRKSEF